MKRRIVGLALTIAFLPGTALAARMDVGTREEAAGAGATTEETNDEIWTGGFDLRVESEVRSDEGTFTYFYKLSQNSGTDSVESMNLFGDWVAGNSATLNWGIVTDLSETSAGVGLDPSGGDISFGVTMTANFNDGDGGASGGLGPGEMITFYVQSELSQALFDGQALDDGLTEGQALAPLPEPATALLLGIGLGGLRLGGLRRRARQS